MSKQRPEPIVQRHVQDLNRLLELSEDKLIFLDVHADWCGPCNALNPFLNQLWIDLEDPEKRILLTSISTEIAGKDGLKLIQKWAGNEVKIEQNGCKPLFIVLRHGQAVGKFFFFFYFYT
jgi:thiol-disulfide isomerase/thioredoxin